MTAAAVVAVAVLIGAGCVARSPATGQAEAQLVDEPGVTEARENPFAPAAREVLVQYCGRCHRSELPTAIPGALAVFDLTQDRWYETPSPEQLEKMLGRIRGNDDITPADRDTVASFVRCQRDGVCPEEGAR